MVKLGPIEIIRAATPSTERIGRSGVETLFPSGGGTDASILADAEYNPDLQGTKLYDEIDRMRLSDSQVKAALQAIKLPLRAADWHIEPPTDSPRDREIAEWLALKFLDVATAQDGLRSRSWNNMLRHILLHLDYGVMPFETVWEVADDPMVRRPMAVLSDLAPRMPRTVLEWQLDDNDRLAGIKQGFLRGGEWVEPTIPAEKLVVFVNDQEGANYRGTSILRAARKDWIFKERAQRVNAIALERRAAGVDVGTLMNSDPNTKATGENILMSLRVHERAYVQETEDWKYRIEGIQGTVLEALPTIQYCDLMILRGLLAEFLAMGGNSTGSLAMHEDKTSFFLMSLGAIAKQVIQPINEDLIPLWVSYNWPNVREYPQLTHSRLDRRDVTQMATALAQLIPQGVITPDAGIEREMRELLELPEPPEESQARRRITAANRKPRTAAERIADFAAMARGLDSAQAEIVKSYLPVQRRQINRLVGEAMKAIDQGSADRLQNIGVPYKAEAAEEFAKPLLELYRQGQREVRKELAKMGTQHLRLAEPLDPTDDDGVRRWLRMRAVAVATALAERLRGAMMRAGLDMIRRGDTDRRTLVGRLVALSDREIDREAAGAVSEALNLGRESVAAQNEVLIRAVEYSAIMDSGTCSQCASLDGQRFEFGSEAMRRAEPPYRDCSGFGNPRCRCVFIYTLSDEVPR